MFSEVFSNLLHENKVSAYKVSKETGISQGTMSEYKNGLKTPSSKNLGKIADFFNVSIDYLLGKANETRSSEEERVLFALAQADNDTRTSVDLLQKLNPENRKAALDYLNYLLEKQAASKGNQ